MPTTVARSLLEMRGGFLIQATPSNSAGAGSSQNHGCRGQWFSNLLVPDPFMLLKIIGDPKSLQMVTVAMKLKDAYSLEEKL